jgi:mitochondrial fission protein ELM1
MELSAFDLIVAPEHDNLAGPNVIATKGAIHKVTPQKLEDGVKTYASLFQGFPHPYSTVLLGGSTNRYTMSLDAIENIIRNILVLRDKTRGSVLVTPSFRTPFREVLTKALAGEPDIYLAEIETLNPYFAMLGMADFVFVTDDSVNMVCEACATGKPVYILPLLGHGETKPKKFIQDLINEDLVRPFQGSIDTWAYVSFNDTAKVAALVRKKMSL